MGRKRVPFWYRCQEAGRTPLWSKALQTHISYLGSRHPVCRNPIQPPEGQPCPVQGQRLCRLPDTNCAGSFPGLAEPLPVHTAQHLSTGPCCNVSIMTSNAHAPVLGTGTRQVFRMPGVLEEERDRKRKLWDSQYVSEVFEFVGSRLEDP